MQNFRFLTPEDGTDKLSRSLRNSSQERSSRLLRGGNLKSFPWRCSTEGVYEFLILQAPTISSSLIELP